MDKIARVRQEIKRLKGICTAQIKANPGQTFPFVMEMTGYDKLLSFLDTLSEEPDNDASLEASASYDTQKYTPSPSVDIGDVARVQFAAHAKVFDKKRKAVFGWEQFKEVAGIFYAFGKKDSETKEKEESDKSLEEEISRTYHNGSVTDTEDIDHVAYENIARHFAEWGAEHLRDNEMGG